MGVWPRLMIGAVGTVILGAIGSGLWELVLSKLFSWFGSIVIAFVGSLSQSYVDSLYLNVWKGQNSAFIQEVYVLVFVIYLTLPMMLARLKRVRKHGEVKKTKAPIFFVAVCATALMISMKIWQTQYSEKVSSVLQANINILSPLIGVDERNKLVASFSTISSESKALALRAVIIELSKKYGVSLHDMDFMK